MNLKSIASGIRNLPPSPQVLPKLITLLNDPDASAWDLAQNIEMDPALATQVLTWSNSSFYGATSKDTNIENAISRIGTKEIYKLVANSISKQLNRKLKTYGIDPDESWKQAIACAISMEALADRCAVDPSIAYTTGLLATVGKLLIDEALKDAYELVYQLIDYGRVNVLQAEEKLLECNHAELGALCLQEWKFPEVCVEALLYQYTPTKLDPPHPAACMLYCAHSIAKQLDCEIDREYLEFQPTPEILQTLGLAEDDLLLLQETCNTKLEDILSNTSAAA